MEYEYALDSCVGSRERNEDRIVCFTREGNTVAVVADGMGGHGDGDLAAEAVVNTIKECFTAYPVVNEANVTAIMEAANRSVLALQTEGKDMRSTVVALFLSDEATIVAHAGDSRFYCLDSYRTTYRTKDHSVTQLEVEMGKIKEKDRKNSPDRNRVLKSMGNPECKVTVHTLSSTENSGKGYLLCTDGFWEHYDDKTIRRMMRKSKCNPETWLRSMMEKVASEATEKQDNYSAIALIKRRVKDE